MTMKNSTLWPAVAALVAGKASLVLLYLINQPIPAWIAWAVSIFFAASFFGHANTIAKTTPCTPLPTLSKN